MYYIFTISQYIYINELHLIGPPPSPASSPALPPNAKPHICPRNIYICSPQYISLYPMCTPHCRKKNKSAAKDDFFYSFLPLLAES